MDLLATLRGQPATPVPPDLHDLFGPAPSPLAAPPAPSAPPAGCTPAQPCGTCGCPILWLDVRGGLHCSLCLPPRVSTLVRERLVATPDGHENLDQAHSAAEARRQGLAPTVDGEWNWFAQLTSADMAHLDRPRHSTPCLWCGGRLRHNPLCEELHDHWSLPMPFGKHKGQPIRRIPHEYLEWVLAKSHTVDGNTERSELVEEINRVLGRE